ncbi:DUF1624 domain-containing protein, partial [Thermodesulfobacteriota bacterium]
PQYPGGLEFLTRWITHLCAPGFFFLMGISVVLFAASRERSGWSTGKILRFLLIRGGVLIVLQFVVENPGWDFGELSAALGVTVSRGGEFPGGGTTASIYFGVLYALGGALILCSFLIRLPDVAIVIVSAAALTATQWLVMSADATELYSPLVRLFLIPGHTDRLLVFYPILPWFGIAGFGMVFGRGLLRHQTRAYAIGFLVGVVFLALFLSDRLVGAFGDFHRVAPGWIGLFNTTKYPPSLTFELMTLGMDLVLLAFFALGADRLGRLAQPFIVYGQSALFFYILHLYLYSLIGFAFPHGTSILTLYVSWLVGLLILYPLCYWYGRFKHSRPIESIWRFF